MQPVIYPVSKEKLKQAQDYVIGQSEISLENTENQMIWLGEQLLGGGTFQTPEEIKQAVSRTTAAEIQKILQELLRPERYNLAIIGASQNKGNLKKILSRG